MDTSKINSLVEKSVLASPPDLLFKIINSLDSELSSRQIGEIIGHDQSISAQVLKLSNSSFFGFKGHIKTLDRAINILGTKTVRNITVTTLLFAHTNKVRLWNLDIMNFWLHTFLVADITRELSEKVGLDGDESYIAGLLHDIGKLVLYAQRQEKANVFREVHNHEDIMKYEKDTWGIDSNEMSAMLLEKWNIPEDTVKAVSEYTNPRGGSLLSRIVFVANEFATVVTDPFFKSTMSYPVFAKLLSNLKISEAQFSKFATQIPGIAERGKMIMKVMSKKQTPSLALGRRMITRATLVTPCEFSLSKSLLELIGFTVEVFTPEEVAAYMQSIKDEEEQRKKEYDERFKTQFDVRKKLEEEEERLAEEQEKQEAENAGKELKKGFLKRLFGRSRKEEEEKDDIEAEDIIGDEDATPSVTPINWNPLVLFEQCDPVEIDRASVTSYYVFRDPANMKGNPIPFFFSNPDIKTK